MLNAGIGKTVAACQVNVADSVARFHERYYGSIGQIDAVSQMDVVQIFGQSTNRHDRPVGNIFALGQDEVPEPGSCRDDASNGVVTDMLAACQVQNAQRIEDEARGKIEKGTVRDLVAVRQTEFP